MKSALDILHQANALFQSLPVPNLSDKSDGDYRKTMKRMLTEGEIDPLRPGDARDTYNHRRASLHAGTWHLLDEHFRKLTDIAASGDTSGAYSIVRALESFVERLGPAIERDPPMNRQNSSFSCPPSRWLEQPGDRPRRGKTSKKHDLARLPADWQHGLWDYAVSIGWKYLDALAVHMLTPARPAEFVPRQVDCRFIEGIVVRFTRAGQLIIAFAPVKTHRGKYGTELSWLTFNPVEAGQAARHLAALCKSNGGTVTISLTGTNAMRKALQKLGAAVFPDLEFAITPYHYRHQCIADMKATVGAGDTVAAAAGHCTDRTQAHYGRAIHGHRRQGLVSTDALRPPKRGNVERAYELARERRSPAPPGLP